MWNIIENMPGYQAIKQRSFRPILSSVENQIKNDPMSFMPIGGMKVSKDPFIKGSNFIRESWMPEINAFKKDIAEGARKNARESAARYQQMMKEEAFKRAHQGFDAGKAISNYIYRNIK